MIGLDARFGAAFTAGLVAAVNPCGFVLLPTYLMYFLGMEHVRPGAERTAIPRALKVGIAVAAGFMVIFVVVGAITKLSTNWFLDKAPWVSLCIGLALIPLGVAMVFGYRLPFTTPQLHVGASDQSVRSMFVFGIAYAVASIGCTLPTFVAIVLGGFSTDGIVTGTFAIAAYGAGMGLLVLGLTVSLAMANTAVLRMLRRGMAAFDYVAGVFVILTGCYLAWYWFNDIRDDTDDRLITSATEWQEELAGFIERNQTSVVAVAAAAIGGAVVAAFVVRRRPPAGSP